MARKRTNNIKLWRAFKKVSAAQLADRLASYADMHGVDIPKTTASLSRIESGLQNFHIDFLHAVAEVLATGEDDPTPGDLLDVNPFAGTLQMQHALDQMTERQQRMALGVLQAMFAEEQREFKEAREEE